MTTSEENYLKVIYHLSNLSPKGVNTNAIAAMLDTKASSVTDMLKKLSEKDWINYQKYQGVSLTDKGKFNAKIIVRKHRLWEVFLVEKLGFAWDEVHEVAEELEHIQSEKLINQLDQFLNFPSFDPHGDPIPNAKGEIKKIDKADLQYPILIFVEDDGSFISIIDGHHRAQKAIRKGLETIKAKIIPINSLPKDIRKVFSHMGRQEEMKEGELTEKCWKGYTKKGMKTMFGKRYPNCVKKTK